MGSEELDGLGDGEITRDDLGVGGPGVLGRLSIGGDEEANKDGLLWSENTKRIRLVVVV